MSDKLTDRLRCRYAVGPIMANGEPEFGWRDMSGDFGALASTLPTPIMLEAAERIEQLENELASQAAHYRAHYREGHLSGEVDAAEECAKIARGYAKNEQWLTSPIEDGHAHAEQLGYSIAKAIDDKYAGKKALV